MQKTIESTIHQFVYAMLIIPLLLTAWQGDKLARDESAWRELLGEKRYFIMREKGTEKSYSGEYVFSQEEGTYHCAACDLALFNAADKTFLGCGWPTFTKPIASKNVYYLEDVSLKFKRYEVLCRRCDSHLGHVFKEGDLRYCINSICMILHKSNK